MFAFTTLQNLLIVYDDPGAVLLFSENYEQTIGYFDDISENRRDVLRVMYDLGDKLLLGKLQGNSEEWKKYVCRVSYIVVYKDQPLNKTKWSL